MLASDMEGSSRGRSIWTRTPYLYSLQMLRDIAGTSSSANKYCDSVGQQLVNAYAVYIVRYK